MGFIKRNPLFSAFVLVALGVFGLFVALYFMEKGAMTEEVADYERNIRRLKELNRGVPLDEEGEERVFPTEGNLETLQARLEQYEQTLEQIKASVALRAENYFQPPANEVTFLPKLQGYIRNFENLAEELGIALQPGEAFGFTSFARQAANPPVETIPVLDKQRQILRYILTELFQSEPQRLVSVKRGPVELEGLTAQARQERISRSGEYFVINTLVSARTDYIRTMAFQIEFEGYSESLRQFLNRLAEFELPIVVRAIQVRPAQASGAGARPSGQPAANDPEAALRNLFGGFETPEVGEDEGEAEADPIIDEVLSRFRVTLEFIEVEISNGDDEPVTESETIEEVDA